MPTRLPLVNLPVASFVAEAFKREPEISAVECVSVTETAAEKLVALTRRTAMNLAGLNRGEPDDTLVRHIFDLHCVRERIDRTVVIDLAREIARQDAEEFGNQYPAYREDIAGETRRALTTDVRNLAGIDRSRTPALQDHVQDAQRRRGRV